MKTVLSLAFFLIASIPLYTQEKSAAELKELFYDAEFFFAQEEYTDALYDYIELYSSGFKDNANINYKIGICYLNIPGQKEKSIDYLLEAVKNVSKRYKQTTLKQIAAPLDAYLFLGNAYRVNNKLNDAIAAYNKYKELASSSEEIKYADQQIAASNTAIRFMDNPLKIKFTNLGDSINGSSSNFKGVVSGNGRTILYMNELPFYNAVYYSIYTDHGWSSPINITPQIQSDGDQYVTSVSYDGTWLILTREDAFNSDLYESRYSDGKWSKSVPLEGQNINTKFWESHGSITKEGTTLFFTSNRKDGLGEMDIYMSNLMADGKWGEPVNLGPLINTPLNEDTPFITENDSMLYFSSQGHENMGGYDIFISRLDHSGQWTMPQNIGYPLNTTDDDLFFYPWNNAKVGFISRIIDNGFGKEDIYAVQPDQDKELAVVMSEFFEEHEKPVSLVSVQLKPAEAENKPDSEIVKAEVTAVPAKEIEIAQPDVSQVIVAASPKEITLEPVYFEFDHFQLTDAGKSQLEIVYGFLKDNPTAQVRFIGHADARGSAEYNQKLSEKRASVTMNYIKNKGVDAARLEFRGMGERNFAAINTNPDGTDNPEGRRLNRRVEFEIIGSDKTPIIIRMKEIPENLKYKE